MIRGTKRNKPALSLDVGMDIHNRFDIEVMDAATGEVKRTALAHNVICNNLWSKILSGSTYFSYIHYGAGTGSPSASDTALFSYLGGKQVTFDSYSYDCVNGVFWIRQRIQITELEHVGSKITEVGVAYTASGTTLCTHAMLKDMNGNLVSIEKSDTDIINVYATIYVHFNPNGYDNGSIKILGPTQYYMSGNLYRTTYGILGYLCGYGGAIPSLVYPARHHTNRTSQGIAGTVTYSIPDRTITITAPRLAAVDYNVGGLTELGFGYPWNYYGTGLSARTMYPDFIVAMINGGSWFPYSEVTAEAVGTGDGATTEYDLRFPYAHDVTVYVDGVIDPDVEVQYSPNLTTVSDVILWIDKNSKHDAIVVSRYVNSDRSEPNMFINPAHQFYGLATVYGYNSSAIIYASNDLDTWVEIGTGSTVSVPEEYQHYKYWKSSTMFGGSNIGVFNNPNTKALKFANPPAEGAVIIADYKCDCIAKDSDHVFDFSMTIHLNELVED